MDVVGVIRLHTMSQRLSVEYGFSSNFLVFRMFITSKLLHCFFFNLEECLLLQNYFILFSLILQLC